MTAEERREKTIKEQGVALINGLRLAVNLSDALQVPVIAGAVEKHITAAYEAGRSSMQEEAQKAVEDEKVKGTMLECDFAYNEAIDKAAAAIRALKP